MDDKQFEEKVSTKGLFDSDFSPECEDCGEKMVYVGEHYCEEEGMASTYICIAEYPEDVKSYRNSYRSHVYHCRNRHCERCGGTGWEIRNKKCRYCEAPKEDYKELCDCFLPRHRPDGVCQHD